MSNVARDAHRVFCESLESRLFMDYGTPLATEVIPASPVPAITAAATAPKVVLAATTQTITQGDTVSLNWTSVDGATLVRSNFGAATPQGTIDVSPIKTTTYQLTIADGTRNYTAKVTVKVQPLIPIVNLGGPSQITAGDTVNLDWQSVNAASVVSSNFGAADVYGDLTVSPLKTTVYKITVITAYGRKASATWRVNVAPLIPTVSLSGSTSSITAGESVTLNWSSTNALLVSSNFGATDVDGTLTLSPTKTTTYKITVTSISAKKATAFYVVKVGTSSTGTTIDNTYVGHWLSATEVVGSVNETRAWADITVKTDGTFSGRAASYEYAYTWDMPTAWGPIPQPVYRPGSKTLVHGRLSADGSGAFVSGGKTYRFTSSFNSDGELVLTPDGNDEFTHCIMEKQS